MITLNGTSATREPQQQPAVNGHNHAAEKRRQSRYRSTCHACGKTIEVEHWVVPFNGTTGRPRWKHEDCDNVPEVVAKGVPGQDDEARKQIMDLCLRLAEMQRLVKDLEDRTPRSLVVQVSGHEPVELNERTHPALAEILELFALRKNVFMPGPAGCGKTHLAAQVAKAFGLRFAAISCTAGMSESQLVGRLVPRGKSGAFEFVGTEFLDCYENGGVFLFDEIDAADPNVLLIVNSALANGHMTVPSRPEKPTATRHPDFRCIAAANTFGRGADRQYVGRSQLDESTLDRFRIGTVPLDYDRELEAELWRVRTGGQFIDELESLWSIRVNMTANRLERVLSTRFLLDAADVITAGKPLDYVLSKLFAGWREDEIRKAKGNL